MKNKPRVVVQSGSEEAESPRSRVHEQTLDRAATAVDAGGGGSLDARASLVGGQTVLPELSHDQVSGDLLVSFHERERFVHRSQIGEGGMGDVFLVHDQDIDRDVAIKFVKKPEASGQVVRFAREVRALGNLSHPGIVRVHDVGRNEQGGYYLVMEHVAGETLGDVIDRLMEGDATYHARFDWHERLRISSVLLRTMEYVHAQGYVHRDLKPSNIMIGPHGEVTVLDWGLAKRLTESSASVTDIALDNTLDAREGESAVNATQDGRALGTPMYMSPEQAVGQWNDVGPRSDLYSLGVLLHEFFTLEHYMGDLDKIPAILAAVLTRQPRFASDSKSKHQSRVPRGIAYLLNRAMEKDLESRFQSAGEMREALERLISGNFSAECPVTFTQSMFFRMSQWMNARPLFVLTGLAVIAGLASYGLLAALRQFVS